MNAGSTSRYRSIAVWGAVVGLPFIFALLIANLPGYVQARRIASYRACSSLARTYGLALELYVLDHDLDQEDIDTVEFRQNVLARFDEEGYVDLSSSVQDPTCAQSYVMISTSEGPAFFCVVHGFPFGVDGRSDWNESAFEQLKRAGVEDQAVAARAQREVPYASFWNRFRLVEYLMLLVWLICVIRLIFGGRRTSAQPGIPTS